MSDFDRLVTDYRRSNCATLVRSPDVRDVVRRAARHRRRQVVASAASAALVIGGAFAGVQSFAGRPAPEVNLVATTGTPRALAGIPIDLHATQGVAGTDALWLVGQRSGDWKLAKVTAPSATVVLEVALDRGVTGLAATPRFVWLAQEDEQGGTLKQIDSATGATITSYPLPNRPVAVHATDAGLAWVTEASTAGITVRRVDGISRAVGEPSRVIPGEPGTPASVVGGDRIFVHTRVDGMTRVTALSSKSLKLQKPSLSFGSSQVRDIAFTEPIYLAIPEGDGRGFWTAPNLTDAPQRLLDLPTHKVTTTKENAWALSSTVDGARLSRYDRASAVIGTTIDVPVDPADVDVLVADKHFVWLVDDDRISVFGPS